MPIVFASGNDQITPEGLFQRPVTETTLAYVISLIVAGVTLYFFQQIEAGDPLRSVVEQTLVVGRPTTIGGAAGDMSQPPRVDNTPGSVERDSGRDTSATAPGAATRTTAEWITLGISAMVLLAVVGLVSYLHVSAGDHPPMIAVEARLDEIRRDADAYYLPVDVRNRGDRTAGDVQVRAELDTGSGAPVTAEFTVTFLAGGEEVEGTFVFNDDPTSGILTVEATSFREP